MVSMEEALETVHRPTIFAAMLDNADSGSEFKIVDNEKYFSEVLIKDFTFVEALKRAHERGVEVKFLLGPPVPKSRYKSEEDILFDELCGAYAYGGIDNLKEYFRLSGTKNGKPFTEEEAYEQAKSFERDIPGNRKYSLRIYGSVGKLLKKYKTIEREDSTFER